MTESLRAYEWWQILAVSVALNAGSCMASVAFWGWMVRQRGVGAEVRSATNSELAWALGGNLTNTLCLIPVWWLWAKGYLPIEMPRFPRVVLECLYLLIAFDLIMYVVHRAFHYGYLYRLAHVVHHRTTTSMSSISLFVMHPIEAAGFASIMVALMWLWPVSVVSVGCFYAVNLLVGTLAHVPTQGPPKAASIAQYFGGSASHQEHHRVVSTNFGFFSTIWDRMFRTASGGI